MTMPELIRNHSLAEEILDGHRDHAHGDEAGYNGYRGHVYRVLNFARALVPDEQERDDKLAIAAAFHDIDAFTSLNYLAGAIRAQDAWLKETGRQAWAGELAVVIAEHHRFTKYRGNHAPLVEAFRRADRVDVSQGLVRSGIPRTYVSAVREAFDVGTFFSRVVRLSCRSTAISRSSSSPGPSASFCRRCGRSSCGLRQRAQVLLIEQRGPWRTTTS